jgi:(2Fe-2S) ferredoxin
VKSGTTGAIALEMRNVSGAPLTLDVDDSCLAFTAEAENAAAQSLDSECGGLCGSGPTMLRVTLEPNGVLRRRVDFEAVMHSVKGDACTERVLGPLPPGSYTLRIFLPWTDPAPIAGNADARASRVFEGALVVDP